MAADKVCTSLVILGASVSRLKRCLWYELMKHFAKRGIEGNHSNLLF